MQCPFCKEKQTISRVLNSCSKALNLRRYTDRHDVVLSHVVDQLTLKLPQICLILPTISQIIYVLAMTFDQLL